MTTVFELIGALRLEGIEEYKSQLKGAERTSQSSSERMQKSFDRLKTTIAAALSVSVITGFTKSLVSAAAEVSASNAQFSATFREVGESASEMFSEVAKATGVMETRLRTAGTKAFSQFKGAGLEANDALAETRRYLNLASDAAAYYDISLEDADMRLRSFIRGNVEAGDMIGLFTSESQRNAKALEEYGKKYIELTEAQKQMVMLNISEEIYTQSGAMGQASRESGEYANVTGNLAESWLRLKAILGEPILETVNSMMQDLTEVITNLTEWVDRNRETIDFWIDVVKVAATVAGTYVVAMKGLEIVKTITTLINGMTIAQKALNSAISINPIAAVVSVIAGLVVAYKNATDHTDKLKDATRDLEGITTDYNNIVNTLTTDTENLTGAQKALYEAKRDLLRIQAEEKAMNLAASYSGMADDIKDATIEVQKFQGELDALDFIRNNDEASIRDAISSAYESLQKTTDKAERKYLENYISSMSSRFLSSKELNKKVNDVYEKYSEAQGKVLELQSNIESSIITSAKAVSDGLLDIDVFSGNSDLLSKVSSYVEQFTDEAVSGAKEAGKEAAREFVNGFAEGADTSNHDAFTSIISDMQNSLKAVDTKQAIFNTDQFVVSAEKVRIYKDAINDLIENGFEPGSPALAKLVAEMKKLETETDTVEKSFQDMVKEFQDNFMGTFEQIFSAVSDLVTAIQDLQNQALENEINALEEQYEKMKELNEEKLEDKEDQIEEENDALKQQLYDGEISYKQYNDALKANDQELKDYQAQLADEEQAKEEEIQKKKDELAKKQFEANKATQIANVWIQAATGVMTAFAQLGPIAGAIAGALVLATAGVQTGVIASQKYVPAMAKGGIVDKPTLSLIGEDGKEAVVPLENNTEWTRNVAAALAPSVSSVVSRGGNDGVREEVNALRQMIAEFFIWIREGNMQVVMDGKVVGRLVTPYVNAGMGTASRLRARGI